MPFRKLRLVPLLALVGLIGGTPGAVRADLGDRPVTTAWKSGFEFLSQMLSADPSRVILDHVVSVSSTGTSITFDFQGGGTLSLGLESGDVRIDGRSVGSYPAGGALEASWRQLALEVSRSGTPEALGLIRSWAPEGLSREEMAFAKLLRDRVAALSAPPAAETAPQVLEPAEPGGLRIDLSDLSDPGRLAPLLRATHDLRGSALRVTVPGGQAHAGHFSVGSAERLTGHLLVIRGNADIYGTVIGNVATVDGDVIVHPGGVVTGDALAVAGQIRDLGGEIRGEMRTLDRPHAEPVTAASQVGEPSALVKLARNGAGVVGVFLTLLLVGFGLVLFARPPLEVVSDTVLHSFSRSLLVGLLGQVLVLPTFGMLIVGLVLSVAGILLVPFAVIVFALLLIVAVLGGFLSIAHAMGETLTRRQLARGAPINNANSYRYVTVGLAGVAALWLSWVLFGWVPVAGTLIMLTATLVTWLLATVGFGAALLSRAGFREHFAGRLIPAEALTDEYLWATPQFGVTAVKRPPKDKTPTPLP